MLNIFIDTEHEQDKFDETCLYKSNYTKNKTVTYTQCKYTEDKLLNIYSPSFLKFLWVYFHLLLFSILIISHNKLIIIETLIFQVNFWHI